MAMQLLTRPLLVEPDDPSSSTRYYPRPRDLAAPSRTVITTCVVAIQDEAERLRDPLVKLVCEPDKEVTR